jgi:anti-sigma B factor antagonist
MTSSAPAAPAEGAESVGDAAPAALTVEGEMTVYRAVELKDAILGALRRSGPVELDLSRVTEIDSAGIQVLLLGKQLATARHQELRLTAISPAVDEVLALLNLRGHLGLASSAEALAPAPTAHAEATQP